MNVLINSDEWMAPWIKEAAISEVKQQGLAIEWNQTKKYIRDCKNEYKKTNLITVDFKHVNYLLNKDLQNFRNKINSAYKQTFKTTKVTAIEKIQELGLSDQQIINTYLQQTNNSFAKTIAPQIDCNLNWIIDESQADFEQAFFIRNIINNEQLLNKCLQEKLDFWFVDTGYTNFLHEKQKVWHRLVYNHIHHGYRTRSYPTDRLHLLPKLPRQWRKKGSTVLIIESSPAHYAMHGTTLDAWRASVTEGIRAVTDRPIEFRPKEINRKERSTVYDLLKESKEYYCVVSDSSAAAVEAIWAGVPVVTIQQHITNSVSRRTLAEINNLFRGDIDEWLAMLSYSQFTFEELCNGTAVGIVKEYHNV